MPVDPAAILRGYRGAVPQLAASAWVAPGATVVGDVTLGEASSVWYGCVLRGDVHHIRIGDRTNIQDGSVLHVTGGRFACTLGREVTVGHRAVVHGATVEDGALIAIGAVVLDGARVGAGALVGAGAVVAPGFEVPEASLVLGVPAKVVRRLSDEELASQRETAAAYVVRAREHAAEEPVPAG